MSKHISTLIEDIYSVVLKGKEPSEEHLDIFAKNCKEILKRQLAQGLKQQAARLRMSNIGQKDRKLWYTLNGYPQSEPKGYELINFMYGNIIEEFALFLARHAGHKVDREQKKVTLEDIDGSLDCYIDDVLTDVKGMSPYGYNKFLSGTILRGKDNFGYLEQISGYALAEDKDQAAFFVMNKANGHFHLSHYDDAELVDSHQRIINVKGMVAQPEPPERCYKPIQKGKSGNEILPMDCFYCGFKYTCHADANEGKGLKVFEYSTGPVYFTKIEKEPKPRGKKVVFEEIDEEE